MPLIPGSRLLERFRELVGAAHRIDIAVAWASSFDAINVLEERSAKGAKIRAIIGTSENFTNPSTLHHFLEFAELRIPPYEPPRIFHPKYYCFNGEKTVCWVGSANLTRGGFGRKVELVHEFELKKEGDQDWFERLWNDLKDQNPLEAIEEYQARYKPPKRTPRPPSSSGKGAYDNLPSLVDINTWTDFVEGIRAYDEYYRYIGYGFDVLGETHSWLHTIDTGHEIVLLNNWLNLTQRECRILRGITTQDDDEGDWALLGNVGFQAKYVLNNDHMPEVGPDRQLVRNLIKAVVGAGDNMIGIANEAVQKIRAMRRIEGERAGIGHAAATRWLSLARPDCCVSVNGASARGLGEASSLPQNPDGLANVYADLLAWLHGQKWFTEFNGGQPDDQEEREIWNRRAALVDVFVYDA